jgi:LacI family transcriptional regulator
MSRPRSRATTTTLLITASSEENPDLERPTAARPLLAARGRAARRAGRDDHSFLRADVEMGIPVVFLDRPASGLTADTVLLDNRGGSRAAVRSLVDAGHRRVAVLLDSNDIYTMRERLAGAREALAKGQILVRDGVRDPASAAQATGRSYSTSRSADRVLHPQQPPHRRARCTNCGGAAATPRWSASTTSSSPTSCRAR